MPDAFISYSRRDSREFVERLSAALAERGKDAWVDLEDIPPASKWEQDLREGVAGSDAFCFVISPGSVASEHCLRELDYASERNKRLVPVNHVAVADADVPAAIASHNWIPQQGSFEDDFEASVATLVEAIETDLDWVRAHTRWGERAEEWDRRERDRSLLARGSDLTEAEQFLAAAAGRRPEPTELQGEYVVASRAAASRRQRVTVGAVSVALVVSLGLAVFALFQRQTAIDERETATSRALAANSFLSLPTDPELSLLLGIEAADAKRTAEAEDALRSALLESRVRLALEGHTGGVTSAEFSPDGATVLTTSEDETGALWDPATGERRAELVGHEADIPRAGAFSEDGTKVLTYAPDGTARVWSAEDGSSIAVLEDRDDALGRLQDAAFSPDGSLVATAPFVNSTAKIWDVESGTLIRELPQDTVDRLGFSPDGKLLITADQDEQVSLWRVADGERLAEYAEDAQTAYSHAGFSPGGDLFVTAGADGFARLRRLDGSVVATLEHAGPVVDVAFSPDGERIATAGEDGVVKVWSTADGSQISVFDGHGAPVNVVAFSPDGTLAASGGDDGRALLWAPTSGSQVAALVGHSGPVVDLDFDDSGSNVVTASTDETARIWTAALGGGAFGPGESSPARGFDPAFSADGAELLAEGGGHASVIETDGRDRVGEFSIEGSENLVPALGPGGELALTTRGFRAVAPELRSTADGTVIGRLNATRVHAAGFSPDGERIVVGGYRSAGIHDLNTGELEVSLIGHDPKLEIQSAEFSDDGAKAVTSSLDRTVRIWDAATGEQLIELPAFGQSDTQLVSYSTGAVLSPSSELVATWARYEADANLWDAVTGELVATLEGQRSSMWDVAFSPSGRYLATVDFEGVVRLWEGQSGRLLSLVADLPGYATAVDFAPGESEILVVTSRSAEQGGENALLAVSCDVCVPIGELEGLARDRVTRELTANERRRFGVED
jgi:WD40 repeat protein